MRGDLEIIDIDFAETLFIEIRKPHGRNIIVGVFYRPPDGNLDLFLQQFNELMLKISRENKICYIMGDFNLNLMNHQSSPETGEFLDSIHIRICFISAVHRSRRAGAGAGVLTYFAGAGAGVCSPPVKL